jgi:hypothetical protein
MITSQSGRAPCQAGESDSAGDLPLPGIRFGGRPGAGRDEAHTTNAARPPDGRRFGAGRALPIFRTCGGCICTSWHRSATADLENLAALKSLELLDIWEVPQMSDATVDVIAGLPNLKQLSIRTTGVTDAAIDKLLEMPNLESLTFKENGMVTAEGS